ncbi:MAG TPA: uroporphyrinogen decarboxylase family protein [Acidobacteriota bacterium]|nr:uroporphyrinogen decarboxylase family protein [Acidobacteriota bacterium]
MGKADDFSAVLTCQAGERVPLWELEFHAWDLVYGGHLTLEREFERLSDAQREAALYRNAEIILSVCAEIGFAAVTGPGSYWEQAPGELAYYVLPDDYPERQIAVLRELAGDEILLVANAGGVMAASYDVDFCEMLYHAPEEVDLLAQQTLAAGLEKARRFRDAGAEVVMTASDIADNNGLFFNPQQMDRFILPYLEQWSDSVHQMGMFSLMHSDGNLTPCLERIAKTSLDALQGIDPVAGMNLLESKEIVGDRLCLCGNVDCGLLVSGPPEAVYCTTADLLARWGKRGGLVLGASNAVQREVPLENYHAMIAAWKAYPHCSS